MLDRSSNPSSATHQQGDPKQVMSLLSLSSPWVNRDKPVTCVRAFVRSEALTTGLAYPPSAVPLPHHHPRGQVRLGAV